MSIIVELKPVKASAVKNNEDANREFVLLKSKWYERILKEVKE